MWRLGKTIALLLSALAVGGPARLTAAEGEAALRRDAAAAMKRAAEYFHGQVATHGGYVYHYSLDLQTRWGEGRATPDQIWVQPPGTPTVGLAYLAAYRATGDPFYLTAARDAAEALVYGQLKSGGWTNCVDFDPRGARVADYRHGRGRGKNNSSLDDGQTQSALRLLIQVDKALDFQDRAIRQSAAVGLEALLAAQFPNGAFPQVWTAAVTRQPIVWAQYPDYDWRTDGRIKNYWDMYTLNDDLAGYVSQTLIDAHRTYGEEKYLAALKRLGDFLILAQLPEPQPAWAQQYNFAMQPIWARRFEPPAVSGSESQDVLETLLRIVQYTGDRKYLQPVPRALAYLHDSRLPDGRLARYYELKTNRPLYMQRRGDVYTLTYDDSDLPAHYGWKVDARVEQISAAYQRLLAAATRDAQAAARAPAVRAILEQLDEHGRWVSMYEGERLVGQPKFAVNSRYLASAVFSRNLQALSEFLLSGE